MFHISSSSLTRDMAQESGKEPNFSLAPEKNMKRWIVQKYFYMKEQRKEIVQMHKQQKEWDISVL